jgi:hypothetical protein
MIGSPWRRGGAGPIEDRERYSDVLHEAQASAWRSHTVISCAAAVLVSSSDRLYIAALNAYVFQRLFRGAATINSLAGTSGFRFVIRRLMIQGGRR